MTFDQYLQTRLNLADTAKTPDKIVSRLLALHTLAMQDETQEKECTTQITAVQAQFKAAKLERKEKASLAKRDESDRKADTHTKILIGIAAIKLARTDPNLAMRLSVRACGMPSARVDLIHELLGITPSAATGEAGPAAAVQTPPSGIDSGHQAQQSA